MRYGGDFVGKMVGCPVDGPKPILGTDLDALLRVLEQERPTDGEWPQLREVVFERERDTLTASRNPRSHRDAIRRAGQCMTGKRPPQDRTRCAVRKTAGNQ